MTKGNAWTVLVVFLLLGVGAAAINTGASPEEVRETKTNETATIDYDTNTTLGPDYAVNYSDTITVYANGSELAAGTDYQYNSTSGVVDWLNTTATSDGDTAKVSYSFGKQTASTRINSDLLETYGGYLGLFGLFVAVGMLWKFTGTGGAF
jgi:outer membrane lipoprotein-sorting protein